MKEAVPNDGEGFVGAVLTFGCRNKAAPIWADQRKGNGNLSLLPFRWTLPPSQSSLETILGTHPRLSPGVLH